MQGKMPTFATFSPKNALFSATNLLVFTLLDLLDLVLCYFYRFMDGIVDGDAVHCYCRNRGKQREDAEEEEETVEVSETLYGRKSVFRGMCHGNKMARGRRKDEKLKLRSRRWSDCGCQECISWQREGEEEEKLHLVVKEPSQGADSIENVIFLHGFLSSSAIWADTVFPNISQMANHKLRMLAVDLLGFGRSPKPMECLYTLKDHVDMIEKSVISPFQPKSYHIVAHSMGCIIALALAAKNPESVKSITLIAPPYIVASEASEASLNVLNILAERKIWPPSSFGSAIMSWYEHIGRTMCFLFCRHHLIWEPVMRLLLKTRRGMECVFKDLTKHTHHSAWHTMHNVICGGAKLLDEYLEVVRRAEISVRIIQGDKDQVVPAECSYNLKSKLPLAELEVVEGVDHRTIIIGREKILASSLEEIWFRASLI